MVFQKFDLESNSPVVIFVYVLSIPTPKREFDTLYTTFHCLKDGPIVLSITFNSCKIFFEQRDLKTDSPEDARKDAYRIQPHLLTEISSDQEDYMWNLEILFRTERQDSPQTLCVHHLYRLKERKLSKDGTPLVPKILEKSYSPYLFE